VTPAFFIFVTIVGACSCARVSSPKVVPLPGAGLDVVAARELGLLPDELLPEHLGSVDRRSLGVVQSPPVRRLRERLLGRRGRAPHEDLRLGELRVEHVEARRDEVDDGEGLECRDGHHVGALC
jgi:hypothetical protein